MQKRQKNTTHNEKKNKSIETIGRISKQEFNIVIKTVFHMFRKVEESNSMFKIDMKDIKE